MTGQWDPIETGSLRQGEYVKQCLVPIPSVDFDASKTDKPMPIKMARMDTIVIPRAATSKI